MGPTFIDEKPSRLERMFPDGNGRFGKGTEYHLFNLAANTWQLHYYRYFFGSVRSSRSHNVCLSGPSVTKSLNLHLYVSVLSQLYLRSAQGLSQVTLRSLILRRTQIEPKILLVIVIRLVIEEINYRIIHY